MIENRRMGGDGKTNGFGDGMQRLQAMRCAYGACGQDGTSIKASPCIRRAAGVRNGCTMNTAQGMSAEYARMTVGGSCAVFSAFAVPLCLPVSCPLMRAGHHCNQKTGVFHAYQRTNQIHLF